MKHSNGKARASAAAQQSSPIKAVASSISGPSEGTVVVGERKFFDHFLSRAKAVAASEIVPLRMDVSLAGLNISRGVAAVLGNEDRIRRELPEAPIERIRELPHLVLAVAFAASRVDRNPGSKGTTGALLKEGRALRAVMLKQAEVLVAKDLMPARAVGKVRAARGAIKVAQGLVDLAELFTEHRAAIEGLSAVTAAEVKRAAELGTELRALLKPRNAKRAGTPAEVRQAAKLRDRMWTLLVRDHSLLRRVGAWLFTVEGLDAEVPVLGARVVLPVKTAPPAPPSDAKAAS